MRDTSRQGLMSQTAILNRLVQLGYDVLIPWADHLGYDLAYAPAEDEESPESDARQETRLMRMQCKTGRLTKNGRCFEFNTVSISAGKRGNLKKDM